MIPSPMSTRLTRSCTYYIIMSLFQTRFVLKFPPPLTSYESTRLCHSFTENGEVIIVIIISPRRLLKISSRSVSTRREYVARHAGIGEKKNSRLFESVQLRRRRARRIITRRNARPARV